MLPLVLTAGVLWADLARPLTQEENGRVIELQVLLHEPLPPEVRAYYLAKGRLLAGFLHPGVTEEEVRQVLGIRPSGWAQEGERWTHTCSLLGLTVRYRVAGLAVGNGLGLVVEEVEATPP
jgi:hypothetical protein